MTQEQIYYGIKEFTDGMGTLLNVCSTLIDAAARLHTASGEKTARRLRATADSIQRNILKTLTTAALLTEGEGQNPYEDKQLCEAMAAAGLLPPKATAKRNRAVKRA